MEALKRNAAASARPPSSRQSPGTYSHRGLFFGGTSPTWARRTLEESSTAARQRQVAVITTRASAPMVTASGSSIISRNPRLCGQASGSGDITSPEAGTSTSAPLIGTNGCGIMARSNAAAWIAQVRNPQAGRGVRGAAHFNWLWRRQARRPRKEILSYIRYCFAPDDPQWQEQVWERALNTQRPF